MIATGTDLVTIDRPSSTGAGWWPNGHLIRAERIKLTKRTGLMIASAFSPSAMCVSARWS